MKTIALSALVGLLLFIFLSILSAAPRPGGIRAGIEPGYKPPPKPTNAIEALRRQWCRDINAEKLIAQVVASGLVRRRSSDWSEVQVTKSWYLQEADGKEAFLKVVGACLRDGLSVEVKDAYSGKVVGTYGPLRGARFFE